MDSWHSYPSIYALGHKAVQETRGQKRAYAPVVSGAFGAPK